MFAFSLALYNRIGLYRIWQMGFANCSTSLVSMPTVNAQVDGALTAVEGDCQYVLFKVTVPPQVVIESDGDIKFNVVSSFRHDKQQCI
jgi:hypothetical protein